MSKYSLTVIVLFLFIALSDIELPLQQAVAQQERSPRNEGYVAFIVNESPSIPQIEKCECNGDKVIKTGDGRTLPCPCTNCQCKKETSSGIVNPTSEKEEVYQMYLFTNLLTCAPCIYWDKNVKPELVKLGWGVSDKKDSKIRVLDINNPEYNNMFRQMVNGDAETPTFVMLKNGKPVDQKVGAVSAKEVTDLWYKWYK